MSLSKYPNQIDTDKNLHLVRDNLRVKLAEDYNPGDKSILIYDPNNVMNNFPETGIITLTEQCSEISLRALSLEYSSKTTTTFEGLVVCPGFEDTIKPKDITNVTLEVIADHHEAIKDAVIAIQEFVGVEGVVDSAPYGETIEGRLNFLRKLIFTPRAWFTANKTIGIIPLEVTFKEESFRLGDGSVSYIWSFGDANISDISSISTISAISVVPIDETNVYVMDMDGGEIIKTYTEPGLYTVRLQVSNEYGSSEVIFEDMINARIEAPEEATIEFDLKNDQRWLERPSPDGGPYTTTPRVLAPINSPISMSIPAGRRAENRAYSGQELVKKGSTWVVRDPIEEYSWIFNDELTHPNAAEAEAMFAIGGEYDLILRVDSKFGSYRITKYPKAFNIMELQNIWLWTFEGPSHPENQNTALDFLKTEGNVNSYEFGLLSETFKSMSPQAKYINRNDSFLDDTPNEYMAKKEFRRNVSITPRSISPSGGRGTSMMYFASQDIYGDPDITYSDQIIQMCEYQGWGDTYVDQGSIRRPWNWICLNSTSKSYFLLGVPPNSQNFSNESYQQKDTLNLSDLTVSTAEMTYHDYQNGAEELMNHPPMDAFDDAGEPAFGRFAVYRTAWKGSTGYILRNNNQGEYFRIVSFYKTEGTLGEEFLTLTKLADMNGPIKAEGQLVSLSDGVFFFNNTGNISAYNDYTNHWETGGAITTSVSFRSLQDSSVTGFDVPTNTLLACSDNDRNAYLSYDYSQYAFIKFNSLELTFSNIGPRPGWQDRSGSQFGMTMY